MQTRVDADIKIETPRGLFKQLPCEARYLQFMHRSYKRISPPCLGMTHGWIYKWMNFDQNNTIDHNALPQNREDMICGTSASLQIILYHTWVWNLGICMCVIVRPRSHMLIVLKKVIPDRTRYTLLNCNYLMFTNSSVCYFHWFCYNFKVPGKILH